MSQIPAEIPYETAQPVFLVCQVIALLLAIYNLGWSTRHLIQVRPLNIFNISLCIAATFLFLHIMGVMLVSVNQFEEGAESRVKAGSFQVLISWCLASILYLLVIQIRY